MSAKPRRSSLWDWGYPVFMWLIFGLQITVLTVLGPDWTDVKKALGVLVALAILCVAIPATVSTYRKVKNNESDV